jgi:putative endonuclease
MTAPRDAFVYVLLCEEGAPRTYVGWTHDLDARLTRHNAGRGAKSTRGRRWRLIYAERCATRIDAMRREHALKRDRALRARLRESAYSEPLGRSASSPE